jgi:hypothetical protein
MKRNEHAQNTTNTSEKATKKLKPQLTAIDGRNLTVEFLLSEMAEMLPHLRAIKRSTQEIYCSFETADDIWRSADAVQTAILTLIEG